MRTSIIPLLKAPSPRNHNDPLNVHRKIETLADEVADTIYGGVSEPGAIASDDGVQRSPVPHQSPQGDNHWSDALQSVLEQPPPALPRYLISAGLLFTAIVGVWSWVGTVEEVSFAQGQLAPQGDVFRIQTTVGGEVTEILFSEGDVVQRGQKIAAIDSQLVEKEIRRLEESLNAFQLQLSQTEALIQQTLSEMNILGAISQADVSAKQSSLLQEKSTIATHQQMLSHYEDDRQAQAERMNRLKELVDKGAFSNDQLFQLEHQLRERDRTITETTGNIDRSEAIIQQLESELSQTQAMAEQQNLLAREKLQQFQIEETNLRSKIRETKILLEKSETELEQMALIAPIKGAISTLEVSNLGEVLQPGETVAEIAPASVPLVLSAWLPSQEAGLVEVGMPVNIKFDAFPYQDYGVIEGNVLSISPDARVDEKIGAAYEVEVSLAQDFVIHEDVQIPLKAGQTAQIEIVVDQRRIISLLLDPIRRLRKSNISL